MEKLFQILAVILIGIAAFFLWRGNNDALFIAAVLGAVCFFLSVRFQVKENMEQRAFEKLEAESNLEEELETEENPALNSADEFAAQPAIKNERQTTDN